jgi:hypothetical protein
VIGSSVSIEDGGYVTHLAAQLLERGIALRNLSVGDQTSVMGYMRTRMHLNEMAAGDVVAWEYSLLDTLLTERLFPAADVHSARRRAWVCLLERGVSIVVVLSAPRQYLDQLTDCEREICDDAQQLGLDIVDMRELFCQAGIIDPHAHFRDDRHPRVDSAIVPCIANAVVAAVTSVRAIDRCRVSAWKRTRVSKRWRWIDAATLKNRADRPAQSFSNALVSVHAIIFSSGTRFRLPRSRLIAVGCVSAHDSGALWCGHTGCVATSVRLPDDLPYAFLLRVTGVACQRNVEDICGAMPVAFANGIWADYGQAAYATPGKVAVFGILLEIESLTAWMMRRLRALHERLIDRHQGRAG